MKLFTGIHSWRFLKVNGYICSICVIVICIVSEKANAQNNNTELRNLRATILESWTKSIDSIKRSDWDEEIDYFSYNDDNWWKYKTDFCQHSFSRNRGVLSQWISKYFDEKGVYLPNKTSKILLLENELYSATLEGGANKQNDWILTKLNWQKEIKVINGKILPWCSINSFDFTKWVSDDSYKYRIESPENRVVGDKTLLAFTRLDNNDSKFRIENNDSGLNVSVFNGQMDIGSDLYCKPLAFSLDRKSKSAEGNITGKINFLNNDGVPVPDKMFLEEHSVIKRRDKEIKVRGKEERRYLNVRYNEENDDSKFRLSFYGINEPTPPRSSLRWVLYLTAGGIVLILIGILLRRRTTKNVAIKSELPSE